MVNAVKDKKVLSFRDLDDLLSLQIWKVDKTLFLGIYNKRKEKGKPVRFSWLEDPRRVLKMKQKRGQCSEYLMKDLEPFVQELIGELSQSLGFRLFCLKTTVFFQNLVFEPKVITNKKDFSLLSENKRKSLWLSDISEGKDEGVFLPCFDVTETEKNIFKTNGEELYVDFPSGSSFNDIRKSGVINKLISVDPDRWYMTFQIAAIGVILGFSGAGKDCTKLMKSLWTSFESNTLNQMDEEIDDEARSQAKTLAQDIRSYVRHFPSINLLGYEEKDYSNDYLSDLGYLRKRRFEIPMGQIGEVSYMVTFYEGDGDKRALGCHPEGATNIHSGDMIFTFSSEFYDKALKSDSRWSPVDEIFTVVSLIRAFRTGQWCRRLETLLSSVLMGNN